MIVVLRGLDEGAVLARYEAYLKDRRYTRGTVQTWVSFARRIIRAYPEGVPLDPDQFIEAISPDYLTTKTKHTVRTGAYRFLEYLTRQEGSA